MQIDLDYKMSQKSNKRQRYANVYKLRQTDLFNKKLQQTNGQIGFLLPTNLSGHYFEKRVKHYRKVPADLIRLTLTYCNVSR